MFIQCIHKRLKYEPTTGEYVNNDGVETRVPDFGGTSSIEYLDPDLKFSDTTNYFHDMVQWFVDKGYTRGKDIVGAPYDWRYSPSEYLSLPPLSLSLSLTLTPLHTNVHFPHPYLSTSYHVCINTETDASKGTTSASTVPGCRHNIPCLLEEV